METEFEKYANMALHYMYQDDEYNANNYMEKADASLYSNPKQLNEICNVPIVGNLYAGMVFYGWKKNRIANLAYWGLSKSIETSPDDVSLELARLLVMSSAREQLKETVAAIFGQHRSPYNIFDHMDAIFDDGEILDKIELAEIISDENLTSEDSIRRRWSQLQNKYYLEISDPRTWLEKAKTNQCKLFNYLNRKIFIEHDLDFD